MHSGRKSTIHRLTALLLLLAELFMLVGCGAPVQPEQSPEPESTPAPVESPVQELPAPAQIRISEYMAKNRAVIQDEYLLFSDWIELENYSEEDILLSGWTVSDSAEEEGSLLPDTLVPAGGHVLIFASGKDSTATELHADFSLSEGEDICLRDEHGRIIHCIEDVLAETDRAYVADAAVGFVSSVYPSPGYANSADGYSLWQQSRVCDSPLVIYEAMNANGSYLRQNDSRYYDWVEIKNVSNETVQLSDYYLSDSSDDLFEWQFPQRTLAPGKIITVICSGTGSAGSGDITYSGFSLSAERDQIYLSSSEKLLDYVSLGQLPYNSSYGRIDGENGFFHFAQPSPAKNNGKSGCRLVAQKPVSLTADGVYESVDSVSVVLSGTGDIYYTTDGSLPTASSRKYTEPIKLTETTVLRSVCVNEGMLNSDALTQSFIINEGHQLPVISIATDSPHAFNEIYKQSNKYSVIPGCVSFYEQDGSFTINCGVKLSGATSLVLPKKNVSVKFRARYGQSSLEYDVFDGGITSFTDLTIRAGQDQTDAIIRNELCQELCLDTCDSVITQRSKYCALYINGRYWGLYCLKEKINEQFYASIAGVEKESVTMVEANVKPSCSFYHDVWALCVNKDMSLSENYEKLCQALDVDSLIDWLIMEGFSANTDLRSGNVRYCHSEQGDGKWRVIFYDLDCAFHKGTFNFYNLLSTSARQNQQVSQILYSLFKNEDFRHDFLVQFSAAINGPLSNEQVLAKIDTLAEQIAPEMQKNAQRWGLSVSSWERNVDSLRSMITDYNWQQYSINNVCKILKLTDEERAQYFGQ